MLAEHRGRGGSAAVAQAVWVSVAHCGSGKNGLGLETRCEYIPVRSASASCLRGSPNPDHSFLAVQSGNPAFRFRVFQNARSEERRVGNDFSSWKTERSEMCKECIIR